MARLTKYIPESVRRALKEPLERRFSKIETSRPHELVIDPANRPLAGKVALVTGATGAIGRAISIRLVADGATVIAAGRSASKLDELVEEVSSVEGTVRTEQIELLDADAIRGLPEKVGDVDILVNNAGGSSREKHAPLWRQSAMTIDDVVAVNLRAPILMTSAVSGRMIERGLGGRIVNLGSTVGRGGLAQFSEYAAAKAGIAGYTRSAALELGPYGINVNCVTPGIVQRGQITFAKRDETLRKGVLPRIGQPEDIAEVVAFLSGPGGEWITGQEIVVDGGRSLGLHGEQ